MIRRIAYDSFTRFGKVLTEILYKVKTGNSMCELAYKNITGGIETRALLYFTNI